MKNKLSTMLSTALSAFALVAACLFAAPSAHAQKYQDLSGLPATIPAATTTNLASPVLIDAHAQDKVGLTLNNTWSTAGESTGSTNLLYTLSPTDDLSTYSTNNGLVTVASYNFTTAGTASRSTTNLSANGHQGWFVWKIQNTSATGVATNPASALRYSVKPNAP